MDPDSRFHPQILVQNGHNGYTNPVPQRPSGQFQTPNQSSRGGIVSDDRLRSRYRFPTVDDALPFAPLTSIVPYSPGMLFDLPTSHFPIDFTWTVDFPSRFSLVPSWLCSCFYHYTCTCTLKTTNLLHLQPTSFHTQPIFSSF